MSEKRAKTITNLHQCRVCLTFDGELKSIFKEGKILNEIVTLATLLNEILSMEITKDDPLPSYMCINCILKLARSVAFQREAKKAYDTFRLVQQKEQQEQESKAEWSFNALDDGIEIIEIDEKQDMLLEHIECLDTEESDHHEDEKSAPTGSSAEHPIVFRKYKSRSDKASTCSYECNICGRVLGKLSSYKYHMDLHAEVAKYDCPKCHEKFKTKNAFTGHLATHTGLFKCDTCGKSYRQAASLKAHMLSHDPATAKPFYCSICDKDFTQKSGLKKHLLTHSDSKMFKCMEDNCGKEFRYSSNYYVHLKSHRGEKDYACETCSKKFSSKEQVKRHNLIHTGEKPFKCDICNRAFNRKSALSVHMGIHESVKKYRCEKCDKGFNQPQGLKVHQNTCK